MLQKKVKIVLDNAILELVESDNIIDPKKWQAIDSPMPMLEIEDMWLQMDLCSDIVDLGNQTKADLPWSEDHFQERLSGPSNPGEQYKNWKYYRKSEDDKSFRTSGIFSHTYQERFWPLPIKGIRYIMGNYSDVKLRMMKDTTTRQAFLSIWHPEDQSLGNRRLPCSIGYWFKISNGCLNLTYLIRSCDATRHFRNDVYMAQRLAMDMYEFLKENNKELDIKLGRMSMWIGSFHCFQSDVYHLKKLIKK